MNDLRLKEFNDLCEKYLKIKSFSPHQIVVQVESDLASHWNFIAILFGIFGFGFLVIGISDVISNEVGRDAELMYLGIALLLIVLTLLSALMVYRKPKSLKFDSNFNRVYVTINSASNQISIQDDKTEKAAKLLDSRFGLEILNTGGVIYATLKINVDTGKAFIIDSTARTDIKVTEKLYKYFMEYTEAV